MTQQETPQSLLVTSMGQSELHDLSEKVMDRFDKLLEHLGLDLAMSRKMYYGACPVHGGDKDNAFNLFYTGRSYRGNWKCHTMQCERFFKSSVIGFVRGVLSNQKFGWEGPNDKSVSFHDATQFLLDFIAEDGESIDPVTQQSIDKARFIQNAATLVSAPEKKSGVTRTQIRRNLSIPAEYYINRGYSSEILNKFDVGLCANSQKPMYNRVVVPVYDDSYETMIGCTGRSIFEQCAKCKLWHNPLHGCPTEEYRRAARYAKWRHSTGFQGESHLYNYWNAKKGIIASRVAVLVEGPGDVWKLSEAGIGNSVGLFGTSLSDGQQILLDGSGAMALVVLTDNDDAGNKAYEYIEEQCSRMYYMYRPEFPVGDVGDMSLEQINTIIKPVIQKAIDSVS